MTIHLSTLEATRIAEKYFNERDNEVVNCVIALPPSPPPSANESDINSFLLIVMSLKNCGSFDGNKIKLIKILRTLSSGAMLQDYKCAIEISYDKAINYYREQGNFIRIAEVC